MLPGGIAILDHPLKPVPSRRRNFKCNPVAHVAESHARDRDGNPKRDPSVRRYPLGLLPLMGHHLGTFINLPLDPDVLSEGQFDSGSFSF